MLPRVAVAALALVAVGVRANGCHDASGNVITGLAPEEEEFCTAGSLGNEKPTVSLWAKQDRRSRGAAPYPFPTDRKYNTSSGPIAGKINVHLVPHTHDDTGWQVTVDQYFAKEVFFVIDTVVTELSKDPNRKFIYVETAFFARWWEQAPDDRREQATYLVKCARTHPSGPRPPPLQTTAGANATATVTDTCVAVAVAVLRDHRNKQLEFINGGWCMHDEASPLWTAMVDQTTRGHQFLVKNFGQDAAPKGTWQIDPFGHSSTQAWLLGAEAGASSGVLFEPRRPPRGPSLTPRGTPRLPGMESLFWGRMDWQDRTMRYNKQQGTNGFEWIWQGSRSLGKSAQVRLRPPTNHPSTRERPLGMGGAGTLVELAFYPAAVTPPPSSPPHFPSGPHAHVRPPRDRCSPDLRGQPLWYGRRRLCLVVLL
jgi:hypothetical protein